MNYTPSLAHGPGYNAEDFVVTGLVRPADFDGLALEVIPVQGQGQASGYIGRRDGLEPIAAPALE